jgi:hypothetical protein
MTCIRNATLAGSVLISLLILNARSTSHSAAGLDCAARLALLGIIAERAALLPAPPYAGCIIAEPVMLISITANSSKPILFPDRPLLSCAMAELLGRFSLETALPMAVSTFGKPLASISTGPGYECRPRNRQSGAKISSHGQGSAIDIIAMELAGGRKISVEKPEDEGTIRFLAEFRTAACTAFNTVLGPGSDSSHANHIHIDIAPRGKKGNAKFCQ